MSRITLEQIGPLLKEKRGRRGLREVAAEIDISPATLSRVESGKQPDLDTFSKLCKWLGVDAGEILGCGAPGGDTINTTSSQESQTFSAHFRAEKTMSPTTALHLGQLILAVQKVMEKENAG